ncbi:MAG: hypothetical protein EOO50_09365 [Flavobacterium sp.]|uniref:hypothetical protein n=1 Tax=Flavobacterium sp. TaxID=239 RepID=UPI0012007A97|nr:hypothetical protein [Flavobacterium sp.]RZJ66571.1 MAG: hypothetical protein EOO50_09365 [Flavobacterium sp.]
MKKEPFQPNHFYLIRNTANNREKIFFEERNYYYFVNLLHRHLRHIGTLHACCLQEDRFEIVIRINDESTIAEKYREKIHLPLSHFFNAYCKGVNKAYGRSGSLFREHFFRQNIAFDEINHVICKLQSVGNSKGIRVFSVNHNQ